MTNDCERNKRVEHRLKQDKMLRTKCIEVVRENHHHGIKLKLHSSVEFCLYLCVPEIKM